MKINTNPTGRKTGLKVTTSSPAIGLVCSARMTWPYRVTTEQRSYTAQNTKVPTWCRALSAKTVWAENGCPTQVQIAQNVCTWNCSFCAEIKLCAAMWYKVSDFHLIQVFNCISAWNPSSVGRHHLSITQHSLHLEKVESGRVVTPSLTLTPAWGSDK